MSILGQTRHLERNAIPLMVLGALIVSPSAASSKSRRCSMKNTIEKVEGMRPYTPLELAGRNIYIREGCYVCHSQMIRPLRDEVERYGHYSAGGRVACTTIRSSGAPSAPGRILPASAASIPTNGMCST
jgi:cytochrome c oxidase cbb3-type subunit 2